MNVELKSYADRAGNPIVEAGRLGAVPAPPKTAGLLWVTYKKDLEWFEFSARSYAKYARGWDFAKCIVPNEDLRAFNPVCESNGIELWGDDRWKDKPFNSHQNVKCHADVHMPGADVIFHCDADCVFAKECSPSDWLPNGKVLMPYQNYETYLNRPIGPDEMADFMSGKKIDASLAQYNWRFAVEAALGRNVERECMWGLPIVHRREVYKKTRQLISERFPKEKFDGYVRSCRDTYQQSFCEFNTLGAVAHIYFEDYYEWWDANARGYPPTYGKIIQSWSHGGLDGKYDYLGKAGDKTIDTARKLFVSLGLLETKKKRTLREIWHQFMDTPK